MLEVCFGDSAKGTLMLAQHCGGDAIAESVGVVTNARGLRAVWEKQKALREYKKRRAELKKLAVPLGGRREDVVSVSLGLSEGDIRSPITPGECPRKACVRDGRWQALQAENAPLRVVEQGRVVSAGLDYYDDLIRQAIPDEPCQTAQIIGTALGKQKVPTGDQFIAKRLLHFIDAGELAVVQPGAEGFYSTVVQRR